MALTLTISDGTTTVDLASTTGFEVLRRWRPVVATPQGNTIPPDITDVIPTYTNITTADGLAATYQALHALAERAAKYGVDSDVPVWFTRQLDTETGGLRTLVRSLSFDPDVQLGSWIDEFPRLLEGRTGAISITRHPFWERTSPLDARGQTWLTSVLAGTANYSVPTAVPGDVAARVYALRLYEGPSAGLDTFWIGARTTAKVADPTNFVGQWACPVGTIQDALDTSVVVDATASTGDSIEIDFANETGWHSLGRFYVRIADVAGGNVEDHFGRFVVLLRAMVSAASGTAQIRLGQCVSDSIEYQALGPIVDVTAESWTWHNLGVVSFPARNLRALPNALINANTYEGNNAIMLNARVKADAPVLLCDCYDLIPVDEWFVHIENAGVLGPPSDDHDAYVGVSPADEYGSVCVDVHDPLALTTTGIPPTSVDGIGIPPGSGVLVLCGGGPTGHASADFSDTVRMSIQLVPRWLSLRGAS